MLTDEAFEMLLNEAAPDGVKISLASRTWGRTRWLRFLFRFDTARLVGVSAQGFHDGELLLRLDLDTKIVWGEWMDLRDLSGMGVATRIVPALLRGLQAMGAKTIRFRANYAGGYVWARMGGVPLLWEMPNLVALVRERLQGIPEAQDAISLLDVRRPESIRDFAASQWGEMALTNSFWLLEMQLDDLNLWQHLESYCSAAVDA